MESTSNKQTRVSTLNVRQSLAGMIGDSEGNLDEKKTVAALSQTHNTNKYLWTGSFVLIGVVCVLIAANIGTSWAVARLTRQLIVDPVTGMATIPGSDNVVMKTSEARYKEEDFSFHNAPIDYLSAVKTVEFSDGNLSFHVKGYARMSNETILLVEGGSLVFDVNGFKNITGDELTRLFSSIGKDMESSDLHGRKLCAWWDFLCQMDRASNSVLSSVPTPPSPPSCGPYPLDIQCPEDLPYCNTAKEECVLSKDSKSEKGILHDWECSGSNPDRRSIMCCNNFEILIWDCINNDACDLDEITLNPIDNIEQLHLYYRVHSVRLFCDRVNSAHMQNAVYSRWGTHTN